MTDAAVEEAGNYPSPDPIFKLFGALRSAGGTPIQLILTFNPGGPGHHWLKQRFIKPAPLGMKRLTWELKNGTQIPYVYIPSRVTDNRILMFNDPGYIDRLHMVGSAELVRAWLEGDFEIHEGTYFDTFSQRHIIAPFEIPRHWTSRYLGFDWGYKSPFAAVWGAVSSGKDDKGKELPYPKNSIIIYREAWGTGIDNEQIAEKLIQLTNTEEARLLTCVADPSIFKHDGGPSIADQFKAVFAKYNFPAFKQADNERISGWAQIRRRLRPDPALLYIFETCPYLIETLPGLVIDEKRPEDLDTTGEDHAADALRYLCKERMLETNFIEKVEPVKRGVVRVQDYVNQIRREQRAPKV